MNQPEAPFYLAIKHQGRATDAVWYNKSPLGKNEIGKLLTKVAQMLVARWSDESLCSKDLHITIAEFRCPRKLRGPTEWASPSEKLGFLKIGFHSAPTKNVFASKSLDNHK